MDSNAVTAVEDSDMADCDGENVVTMMDVLREQEDFENDANAVLGASDEKNCTYPKGYIKRQAIYACMTCCAEAKDDPTKRAGVCLACSLSCHENHELIELYTKRNFRCDCGNPKFNSNACQYTSVKTDLNENNEYNQNFSGLYCVCKRPYPDPENSIEDEMIQCIVCEDWLHASHLEATLPPNDQYSEMICKSCMEKNLFLHDYSNFAVNVETNDVDVLGDGDNVNTTLNSDINNETSKDTEAIQEFSDKVDDNMAEPEIGDLNAPVKDDADINATSANSDKNSKEEQETNSEMAKNIETESKANNIDAESMEEDRLLADPEEDRIEEPKQKDDADVAVDDNKDKNIPDKQASEEVSGDLENKCLNNTTDEYSETIKNNEIRKDENSGTVKENVSDSTDKENINESENEVDSKKTDEKQPSEIENEQVVDKKIDQNNSMDSQKNTETEISESNENKNISNSELHENIRETNESEKSSDNMEDGSDSKTDAENKKELSNEVESSNDKCTKINENSDSKTDLVESEKTKDENNVGNTDLEMKNEDGFKNDNSSEGKATENKRKLSTEENASKIEDSDVSGKRIKLESNCIRPKNVKRIYKGATFWPSDFRQKLCTCNECLTMYKDLSVLFLTDFEDTVRAYESLGEEKERIEGKPASQYEKGLQALSSLDRIQQVNALTEYNKMRDKLLEFLKSFKDRKEVVKEEDIKEFFAGMKPKREPDGVYFCR